MTSLLHVLVATASILKSLLCYEADKQYSFVDYCEFVAQSRVKQFVAMLSLSYIVLLSAHMCM